MRKYDKYKPSGVDWIGEVPEEWEKCRVKNICTIHGRIGYRGYTVADLVEDEKDGAITLSPTNIVDGKLDFSECTYLSWAKYYESPEIMVNEGDFIFVKTASVGKCALVEKLPKETTLNPQIVVFKNLKCSGKFLDYVFKTPGIQLQVELSSNGSTISTISQGAIGSYLLYLPPLSEQTAIASYLDDKCSKIDNVIGLQQKRIALLKELKQSTITKAVTKGLDKNVKMKDSGVEWIGEVPEGWHLKKIKFNFKIFAGATPKTENTEYWDGDIVWVTPADYKTSDVFVSKGERNITQKGYDSCNTQIVPKGSIVFSKRAPIGTVAISDVDLCTNQGCLTCVPKLSNSKYFYYAMSVFTEIFDLLGSGATFKEISSNSFSNVKLPSPSINEQISIASYLDKKCATIDRQISKIERQIELLKEYKQSVITECVTGKRKVCQ